MRRMDSMRIVTLLGVLVLVAGVSSASAATEWTMDLSAEVGGITADLIYGINGGATDGYDDGLDTNAPPADPSGFDAYFNEPGVGTGKLNANIKALGVTKDWTLIVVAPATKTVNVLWTSGDILSNVDMQMQELDLGTGEPTGTAIDMKAQNVTAVTGGAFAATTKAYTVTATTSEPADEPPELVSCIIDPAPPAAQGTNVSIDCLFSETVDYEIRIENVTGLVELIGDGTAKNPNKEWWYTTTETPIGVYTVNVTMYNSTSGLSSYNDTNTIEITEPDTTTYYRDADGDTYGNASDSIEADSTPKGYVEDNTDCDDTNAAINPGTDEVCGNEIDDNCDGQVDEGCDVPTEWTMDLSAEVEGITADLIYGINGGATDGYDDGLDANAPPADPSGFDAYFNEPGVGTGKLNANIKALGVTKDWTLIVVAPATKTVNVLWTSGDILSNVDMQMQELDLGTGEPTGTAIDMKAQNVTAVTGGAFAATTKAYTVTATTTTSPADTTSPVITDVVCDTPTTDSVNITWTTDEAGDSLVKYGTETGVYTDNESDTTMVTSHSVTLTGLDANTTYYFVVNSTDSSDNSNESAEYSFTTTAAQPPDGVTVTIPDVEAIGTITVPITIENASDLGSVYVTLTYDPDVAIVSEVSGSEFDLMFANIEDAAASGGSVKILAYQRSNGLNGDVLLANVTFMAIGQQQSSTPLELEVVTLTDSVCNPIPYSVRNGSFTIFLNGDVNGDGRVDDVDYTYLAKHLLGAIGFEVIVELAADVNGNGEIEVTDCMYLTKHLAGVAGFEELK